MVDSPSYASFTRLNFQTLSYYGLLFIGPAPAPTSLQVPVIVRFVPTAATIYLPLVLKNAGP